MLGQRHTRILLLVALLLFVILAMFGSATVSAGETDGAQPPYDLALASTGSTPYQDTMYGFSVSVPAGSDTLPTGVREDGDEYPVLPLSDDIDQAFNDTLSLYIEQSDPGAVYIISEKVVGYEYAYAIAENIDPVTRSPVGGYVSLLAQKALSGQWQALAPTLVPGETFNQLLASFPENLMDEATKAFLHYYEAPESAVDGPNVIQGFGNHKLPWSYGKTAQLSGKDNCWISGCRGTGHEYQLDFGVEGSGINGDIIASKPGTVVFVKESSNSGACSFDNWRQANMVVIQHGPSEYSWYVHLAYNSVSVSKDQSVDFGTKIGVEGNTGYSCGAHLHFMASTGHSSWTNPGDPNAAPWATGITTVDFSEVSWGGLNVGSWYTSQNKADDTPPQVDLRQNGSIDISGDLVEGGVVYMKIPVKNFGNATSPAMHVYSEGYTANGDLWRADGAQPTAVTLSPGQSVDITIRHDLWGGHVGNWNTNGGIHIWNDDAGNYYGSLNANGHDQHVEFYVAAAPDCGNVVYDGIIFFEHSNCTGGELRFSNPSGLLNLSDHGWNDQASSIHVGPGWSVMNYQHGDGGGDSRCASSSMWNLTIDYFDGGSVNMNDQISSIAVYANTSCTAPQADLRQNGPIDINGDLVEGGVVYLTIPVKNFGIGASPAMHVYSEGQTANGELWRADGADPTAVVLGAGQSVNITIRHDLWGGHVGTWDTSGGIHIWNDDAGGYYGRLGANGYNQNVQFYVEEVIDCGEYVHEGIALFGDAYCAGDELQFSNRSGLMNLPDHGWNDRASSIYVAPGWSVMLYQHGDGGGASFCARGSKWDLSLDHFDGGNIIMNNAISSIVVYDEPDCPFFTASPLQYDNNPLAGESTGTSFQITNISYRTITLEKVFVGAHGPYCVEWDCPNVVDFPWDGPITLAPGESHAYSGQRAFNNVDGGYFMQAFSVEDDGTWRSHSPLAPFSVSDGIEVIQDLTLDPATPIAGQMTQATYTIRNAGHRAITLPMLGIVARGPDCADWECADGWADFPLVENVTLDPGESYTYTGQRVFDRHGAGYLADIAFADVNQWWYTIPSGNRIFFTVEPGLETVAALSLTPANPLAGQLATASFSIRNSSSQSILLDWLGVGVHGPNCPDWDCVNVTDFPPIEGLTLLPGEVYVYSGQRIFAVPDSLYLVQPMTLDVDGIWRSHGPLKSMTVAPGIEIVEDLTLDPAAPAAGQMTTISYSIRNAGNVAITLPSLGVIARGPDCVDWDCPDGWADFLPTENVTLQPGASYTYTGQRAFDRPGDGFIADAAFADNNVPGPWWYAIHKGQRLHFLVSVAQSGVRGKVLLQGRNDHSGAVVMATSQGTPVASTTTDDQGDYQLPLPAGEYTLTVEMAQYLDAEKVITVDAGQTLDMVVVSLFGGDANDDQGGNGTADVINILDLSLIGSRFGMSCGDPGWDDRADINADCAVNILDLTTAGGNFNRVSPVPWT